MFYMLLGTKLSEHMTRMELSLSLMPYSLLLQTTHLIPENVLFDAADAVPGLVSDTVDVVNSKLLYCVILVYNCGMHVIVIFFLLNLHIFLSLSFFLSLCCFLLSLH